MKGTCQFCGCTQDEGCEGGCAWANEEETVCTRCELAVMFAISTMPVMAALSQKAPKDAKDWEQLPAEHRTAVVMGFRMLCDGVRDHMFAALGQEATSAAVELSELAGYLYNEHTEEMVKADAANEPVVDVIKRLLKASAKSRIIIPT